MKKFWLLTLTLLMALTLCFGLTACGDKTVDQLTNELGALLEGGDFEEGSVLNLNDITAEKATEIIGKLEENGIAIDDATKTYIYDIFVSKDNAEVQPDGKVKVTVPMPADEKATGYNVYHMKDNGAVEVIPSTYKDGKVSFETDSFSWYVFTPTYNYVNVNVHFMGDLYVGSNKADGITIQSSYKPLTEYSTVVSKGTYLVGEETTLSVQINDTNLTFLGWYEAESFYNGNYDKPALKDTPVSTETSYTFKTEEQEYAVYAVCSEKNRIIQFNVNCGVGNLQNGGYIRVNDDVERSSHGDIFGIGKTYELSMREWAGYRFVRWEIYGEMSYSTVEEESFTLVTNKDEKLVVAVFEPLVTNLTVDLDTVVYDTSLLEKYTSISIPEFNAICKELLHQEYGTTDYVISGKIKSISNTTWGNMIIVDDEGNELYVYGLYLEDGTRYSNMENKPTVGDYITVHGKPYRYETQPEMNKGYLLNATPTLPNFENVTVHANTPLTSSILNADEFTVDTSALNAAKPGEYLVTYTYKANPEIKATVTVKVLATAPVDFSAYMSVDGTLLLDGVEIGPDYYEVFKDGYGKVTLTAVGAENTVFKGWYTGGDNNPTLISTDATYTFEFDENTYVYADFEYLATEIMLDGMNMGFDTVGGITEIWLPVQGTYDPSRILVFAVINGEPEALTADEYTVDLGGFNATNPVKGDYTLTFTYKANPDIKATHIIRVIDEENMVSFNASSAAGGRVTVDKPYGQFNKGEKVTVTVELRSESDYEFLGWYTVDASGAVGTTCVSTERTYTVTLNETTYLYAKIEPKITRLEVEGYEGEPTRIHISKFWLADREIKVYACGALGKRVELTANDYTVDMGGLNLTNPVVGKYTITYTYKADTSITYTVTVWVYDADYTFSADQDSPDNGWLLFEGALTHEVEPYQYVSGEEITITAAAKEGYTFLGWYLEINKETHCEYELLSTDATYTFTINKDTKLQAKFGAPVTAIDLVGVNQNNNGDYALTIYSGEMIDLSYIRVYAYSLIDAGFLSTDEYAIDFGGLNTADPVAGVYTVTYTYKDEGELTDIKITLTVNVIKRSFYVNASVAAGSGGGYIEYNGNRDNYVSDMLEEGTRITLKAIEHDAQKYAFVRWESYDYENDVWEIYSADRTISFAVEGEMKLRAVFGGIIRELRIHENTNLYDKGVYHWNFDGTFWNEELGRYEGQGDLEISIDSEYANDIAGLFANFNIVAVETNGRHTVIEASDLVIDLGDYKAEEGWYEITVSYGSFTMTVNVMVVPAYN